MASLAELRSHTYRRRHEQSKSLSPVLGFVDFWDSSAARRSSSGAPTAGVVVSHVIG